ncbi:protein obstructor-E-like [Sabethes cyaneus]|uniref:protein obstructor-E-like n=1 Tax=Sabethes cyaneus TaxID=53552 RepID=UPI00237E0BE9|nr:protein obstructor-E-like [Sabethes cyaneus]
MIKYLLLLALVGMAAAAVEIECPEDSDPDNPTLIRHPTQCNIYFICINGEAVEQICPEEYLLALALVGMAAASVTGICPSEGSYKIALPRMATRFIQCTEGVASLAECQRGTKFDAVSARCIAAAAAKDIEIECPEDSDPDNPTRIRHPTQCNIYFICINGEAVEQICPEGTYFNQETGLCDEAENVFCPFSH